MIHQTTWYQPQLHLEVDMCRPNFPLKAAIYEHARGKGQARKGPVADPSSPFQTCTPVSNVNVHLAIWQTSIDFKLAVIGNLTPSTSCIL